MSTETNIESNEKIQLSEKILLSELANQFICIGVKWVRAGA
jgi:hypothetical protein